MNMFFIVPSIIHERKLHWFFHLYITTWLLLKSCMFGKIVWIISNDKLMDHFSKKAQYWTCWILFCDHAILVNTVETKDHASPRLESYETVGNIIPVLVIIQGNILLKYPVYYVAILFLISTLDPFAIRASFWMWLYHGSHLQLL